MEPEPLIEPLAIEKGSSGHSIKERNSGQLYRNSFFIVSR